MSRWISSEALTTELIRLGHLRADSGASLPLTNDRPWYISIVLGFSGWLAGAFVLAFVATLFKPDTAASIALSGSILLAAAFGLYAADRNSEFFDQLALALSIAGQFALTWAAADATQSAAATAALVALMQVVLLAAMPNRLAKILAAFFGCCAWALAIRFAWWGDPGFDSARRSAALAPALAGWIVVWAPICGAVHLLVASERVWMAQSLRRIARPALTGLLVALSVATWASEPLFSLPFWEPEGTAKRDWLALWPLLNAGAALFAAVYAFRLRNRALIGLAAAGALLHVAQFYYLLGASLLIKSAIMISVGATALLAASWLGQRLCAEEDAS